MEPLGIIIYGFAHDGAEKIHRSFEETAGRDVIMFSASGAEGEKISDLLDRGPRDLFEEKESGFVMFLGFDRELVQDAMKSFPAEGEVKRPIFCGLTETNSTWTVEYLMEHLIEEKAYWEKRKSDDS